MSRKFQISSDAGQVFNLVNFSSEVYQFAKDNPNTSINFTFEDKFFFDPFAFLYLGLVLKNIREEFGNIIHFENPEIAGYGANIGFFKLVGFDHGKDVGESIGNQNYLPITSLDIPDENIDIDEIHIEVVDRMQALGEEFAKRLLKLEEGEAYDALAYFCREILRNVIEHSYSETLYYAAQAYKNNKVQVVIADEGDGLLESLNNNPKLILETDKEAVEYALMAGISGRAHKYLGSRSSKHAYKNSGYGLYLTKEICSKNGDFVLISNSAGLYVKNSDERPIQNSPFKGTILRLIIRLDEVGDIKSQLRDTIEKARLELEKQGKTFNEPSKASGQVKLGN